MRKWAPRKSLPEDFQIHNVTMSEITDPSLANTVLDTNSTNALGGVGQGVLGCFTIETGEITLIQGGNWNAGPDPSAIGAGQYSFETMVTHELGHALALSGSSDPNSPMYESLPTGVVKGGLTIADLALPPSDTTNAGALHAAGFGSVPATVASGTGPSSPNAPVNTSSGGPTPASGPSLALPPPATSPRCWPTP
jgi:hypothetical protein